MEVRPDLLVQLLALLARVRVRVSGQGQGWVRVSVRFGVRVSEEEDLQLRCLLLRLQHSILQRPRRATPPPQPAVSHGNRLEGEVRLGHPLESSSKDRAGRQLHVGTDSSSGTRCKLRRRAQLHAHLAV
eukprot:scaffold53276_cov62-Phaeocystis_antarctica.AAC.2